MMFSDQIHALWSSLQRNYTNFRSTKINRKILVFESDDWGGIRMPNPATLQSLINAGLKADEISFNRLDGLERKHDLELLFEVLDQYRDKHGHPAIFTCNMILGNPDFEAIKSNGFSNFVRESMFDSYRRYYGESNESVWKDAIKNGLVKPQFHCREHINVPLWMRDLRAGQPETRLCFDHGFFGLRTKTSSNVQKHYLAAYSAESDEEFSEISEMTSEGLSCFERLFGYPSQTFVACNYVLPLELEPILYKSGVRGIQTRVKQTVPLIRKQGRRIHVSRRTGQRSTSGCVYTVRNVLFEPYQGNTNDLVQIALNEISDAFRWRTPAIVSTHRINYTSAMDQSRRDQNLHLLSSLLASVLRNWPDVEFVSSDVLISIV